MEKTKKLISKKWRALAAIFFLAAFATNVQAQDVTIRGNNGSCVAAVKNGGVDDTFFNLGGFATWQHEQLSMVLTTSDGTKLTPNGQLDNPANNLFKSSDGTMMQIAHGQLANANVCYLSVSLPKGYRFTEYMITFSKPYNQYKGRFSGRDVYFNASNNAQSTFGETNSTFDAYTTQATIRTGGTQQTIKRKEVLTNEKSDMGNVLYFKLELPDDERSMIQLENAVFYFTSEENYSPVSPALPMIEPMTAVDVPFSTSRVDFGAIERNTYNGASRVSYSSANVHDLQAYFTLYEADSYEAGTDIDGVPGNVVKYETGGTISSAGGFFKLGKSDAEQVYFIETPTSVEISDAESHKVPVGYRIVGAEFEYVKSVSDVATRTFYISYTTDAGTYYLNTEGQFSGRSRTIWEMDADGFISSNGYYIYFNNGYVGVQRGKPADTERFGVNDNGIYQVQWPNYYICYSEVISTTWGGSYVSSRPGLISKISGLRASYDEIDHTSSSSSVGDFVLKVYDKTGKTVAQTRDTAKGDTEKITLTGLNNDAVMFSVKGIGLVRATLTLQALDPYLNRMQVVCSDPQLQVPTGEKDADGKPIMAPLRIEQTFTATDFSVNGGEFHFYLPAECNTHTVSITYEDLYSRYLDDSYAGIGSAKNTSRLNFVKSDHYNAFGASQNSLYNNRTEASNPQLERRKVGTVGTQPFKFNNADEVGTSGGTLREFPFSLENYAAATPKGEFTQMQFTVSKSDQYLTRYVFTTDETAYNIAPTTALQHRAYAYYKMIVHVQSSTYTPQVTFNKIYSQTLNGAGETKPYYGVTITATDDAGKDGYASTADVFKIIDAAIKGNIATGTVTEGEGDQKKEIGTYTGWESTLEDAKQLLYFDFSKLAGVYQIGTATQQTMEDFASTNAPNCLFFIPKGGSAPNDNVAFATGTTGIFHAANNIVLTDKEPFYSPYQIEAESQNKIEYKRLITTDKYGKVQNASLILPFALKLEGGKHTNTDGSSFTLHTMQSGQTLTIKDNQLVAYFPALSGNVTEAAANTPYLVKIDNNSSTDGVTFTVSQQAGTIEPSTSMAADYTFSGVDVKEVKAGGTSEGAGTFTFTPKGTYAGQQVPKGNNIFYFAKNLFVNSADYVYDKINVAPFRAYFATPDNGAKFSSFMPVFEEVGDDITAIAHAEAFIDVDAPVYDLQGRMVATSYREAKSLKKGMYVVNGVKFIVK